MAKITLTYDEANETLFIEESYSRLGAIYRLYHHMQRADWFNLLGLWWSSCYNIRRYRLALKALMGTEGPIREMMDEEEQVAYDALPDTITVYRGCGEINKVGASWTTDRSVAEKFPFYGRYLTPCYGQSEENQCAGTSVITDFIKHCTSLWQRDYYCFVP